jgi:hypothetical protein
MANYNDKELEVDNDEEFLLGKYKFETLKVIKSLTPRLRRKIQITRPSDSQPTKLNKSQHLRKFYSPSPRLVKCPVS